VIPHYLILGSWSHDFRAVQPTHQCHHLSQSSLQLTQMRLSNLSIFLRRLSMMVRHGDYSLQKESHDPIRRHETSTGNPDILPALFTRIHHHWCPGGPRQFWPHEGSILIIIDSGEHGDSYDAPSVRQKMSIVAVEED